MEITNENFKENLDTVSEAISEASFIAIDGEFTGLGMKGFNPSAFDTPAERYNTLRQGSADFLMLQFGMGTFKYDSEKQCYVSKVFNFYVFPRPVNRQAPDQRFMCQSSSIDFLVAQGFDFNKAFRHGIPYLNPADEQKAREQLEQRFQHTNSETTSPLKSPVSKNIIPIPEDQKSYVEDTCQKIEKFKKSSLEYLNLEKCSPFRRKLIYQTVQEKYGTAIHLETKSNDKKEKFLVVSRTMSEDDFISREQAKKEAAFQDLEDSVGFSKVVKMLSKSEKLIIGHNMILDLLHLINQFSSPLPEDYEDFKAMTKCIYPRILDTKLMASIQPFKEHISNSALGDLQKTLEQSPFKKAAVAPAEDFPKYCTSSEVLHEAGYDAYITGLCFISMMDYLHTLKKDKSSNNGGPDLHIVEPYLNKLFMMRVYDIPYLDLANPDKLPERDHVFHVTFPKEWQHSDIVQLFSPFGGVQIAWKDSNSALVGLYKREQAEGVLKQLKGDNFAVISYKDYMSRKSYGVSPAAQKRKLPSSDIGLPSKRKRSSSPSLTPSGRNIESIPEEEEMEDGEDEPAVKKMNLSESENGNLQTPKHDGGGDKMFAEPEKW